MLGNYARALQLEYGLKFPDRRTKDIFYSSLSLGLPPLKDVHDVRAIYFFSMLLLIYLDELLPLLEKLSVEVHSGKNL